MGLTGTILPQVILLADSAEICYSPELWTERLPQVTVIGSRDVFQGNSVILLAP